MKRVFVLGVTFVLAMVLSGCTTTGLNEDCLAKSASEDCLPNDQQETDYMQPGTYVVGDDIEAGLYLFQVTDTTGLIQRVGDGGVTLGEHTTRTHTYVEVLATDFAIVFSGGTLINSAYSTNFTLGDLIEEGTYLVNGELAPGDYIFKCDEGYTSATLELLSAVDFVSTSVIDDFTVAFGQDVEITVTIPNTANAVNIVNGHLVPVQ